MKKSARVAKSRILHKTDITCKKNNKTFKIKRSKTNRKRKNGDNSNSENTFRSVLELFEQDKESILLCHLSMLESKIKYSYNPKAYKYTIHQ